MSRQELLDKIEAELQQMDDKTLAGLLRLLEHPSKLRRHEPPAVSDRAFEELKGFFDHPHAPTDMSLEHDRYAAEALAEELARQR